MAIYNPASQKAEEFISDAEIRETLAYAETNKHNLPLIEALLEKARPKKTANGHVCAGLSHREASVLLACDIPPKKSSWPSTATASSFLHRCTFQITA